MERAGPGQEAGQEGGAGVAHQVAPFERAAVEEMLGVLDSGAEGDHGHRRIDALPNAASGERQQQRRGEEGQEVEDVVDDPTVMPPRAPGLERDGDEADHPRARDSCQDGAFQGAGPAARAVFSTWAAGFFHAGEPAVLHAVEVDRGGAVHHAGVMLAGVAHAQ